MSITEEAIKVYNDVYAPNGVLRGVVAHVVQPLIFRAMITHWDVPNVCKDVEAQRDEVHRTTLMELDACLAKIGGMFESPTK